MRAGKRRARCSEAVTIQVRIKIEGRGTATPPEHEGKSGENAKARAMRTRECEERWHLDAERGVRERK